ncbi:MAG TPA: ATP-binding protein [Candidatus Limnocylindria bacterium]|nr:ATP-binding protein [Candidatus Limnocylindria bacterium]
MTRSLRARLFVAQLIVLVAALVLVVVLTAREERAWLVRHRTELLERSVRLSLRDFAAPSVSAAGWPAAAQALGERFGYRVTLIDSSGRVVGDSEVPAERLSLLENHAGRPEVRAALQQDVGRDVRRSATLGVELLYVAMPVRRVAGLAVVRMAEPLSEVARLTASLVRLLAAVGFMVFAVIAVVIAWLTRRHTKRIGALSAVARRLGEGDPRARARELPADDVGRLGQAINGMASELRRRLSALERDRDEREQILAHMNDGVALVDGAGHVLRANRALATILGLPLPPEVGTSFQQFARSPELDELLRVARRSAQTVELDLRLWTPQQRFLRATATRLSGGERDAVLLVVHDLSEVERLNRVRQDFVANVSHELKTPLTSVRGYAETLLEGGLDDLEHREDFVRVIRDQATRLQVLVEDLLSLAELERPDARLRLERFDLREAVERQLGGFRDRAERARLGLELEDGPPVVVSADRLRIEQVLANLLDNALKYTERGRVRVRVGGDPVHAWCEVEDTGSGIPPADLPRIFERFYRVDKARSREKGGTGLGLAIVKHILDLHEGEVRVRSALGEGSVFRIEIPRDASAT